MSESGNTVLVVAKAPLLVFGPTKATANAETSKSMSVTFTSPSGPVCTSLRAVDRADGHYLPAVVGPAFQASCPFQKHILNEHARIVSSNTQGIDRWINVLGQGSPLKGVTPPDPTGIFGHLLEMTQLDPLLRFPSPESIPPHVGDSVEVAITLCHKPPIHKGFGVILKGAVRYL